MDSPPSARLKWLESILQFWRRYHACRKLRSMKIKSILHLLALSLCLIGYGANAQPTVQQQPSGKQLRSPDVVFVPTPYEAVDVMLKVAKVGSGDVVYDLGSGDGRIPIMAVQKYNAARAVGIDINPERIKEAEANLKAAGVGDRVRFLNEDLFEANISDATVVTLYLLPSLNLKIAAEIVSGFKAGHPDRLGRLRHGQLET